MDSSVSSRRHFALGSITLFLVSLSVIDPILFVITLQKNTTVFYWKFEHTSVVLDTRGRKQLTWIQMRGNHLPPPFWFPGQLSTGTTLSSNPSSGVNLLCVLIGDEHLSVRGDWHFLSPLPLHHAWTRMERHGTSWAYSITPPVQGSLASSSYLLAPHRTRWILFSMAVQIFFVTCEHSCFSNIKCCVMLYYLF